MFSRRQLLGAAALTSLMPSLAQAETFTLGQEYRLLTTPIPTSSDVVDVTLFFSYACGHCYRFDPYFNEWAATKPKGVEVVYSPVAFVEAAIPFTQTYYALEALGKSRTVGEEFFTDFTLNRNHFDLTSPEGLKNSITQFMVNHGISRQEWQTYFGSYSVTSRTRQANKLWQTAGIDFTPAVVVGGKYITAPSLAKGHDRCIEVVKFLVEKVKQERKA